MVNETYLGDGVYAKLDDSGGVCLWTDREDTFRGTVRHWIYLEPEIMAALNLWLAAKRREASNENGGKA